MKKFLLGIALALFAGNSFAEDGFTLTPTSFTLKAGETQDIELVINAAVPLTYTSFQINIAMPEGVVPVALNQEEIDLWASMGLTIDPKYCEVTLPSFPAAISGNFQTNTNIFEKGYEIYKQGPGGVEIYERTTTKPELAIVFMSLNATPFPMKSESILKFRVKATDRCYTGEDTFDLTYVTLSTKEQTGYHPADVMGAATMSYVIPFKIGDSGYATFCWPVALDFTGNTFVAGTGQVSGVNMKVNAKDQVPANTPVIMVGEQGDYFLSTTRDEVAEITDNDLEGTVDEPLTVTGNKIFVLADKNEGVGFYRCEEGVVIPQYKAYYTNLSASSDAFVFEETTGINNVEVAQDNADTYTLTGVKVNKANQKGIYVVNGKKVVVK